MPGLESLGRPDRGECGVADAERFLLSMRHEHVQVLRTRAWHSAGGVARPSATADLT